MVRARARVRVSRLRALDDGVPPWPRRLDAIGAVAAAEADLEHLVRVGLGLRVRVRVREKVRVRVGVRMRSSRAPSRPLRSAARRCMRC